MPECDVIAIFSKCSFVLREGSVHAVGHEDSLSVSANALSMFVSDRISAASGFLIDGDPDAASSMLHGCSDLLTQNSTSSLFDVFRLMAKRFCAPRLWRPDVDLSLIPYGVWGDGAKSTLIHESLMMMIHELEGLLVDIGERLLERDSLEDGDVLVLKEIALDASLLGDWVEDLIDCISSSVESDVSLVHDFVSYQLSSMRSARSLID